MKITGKIVIALVVGLILLGFFATLISVLSLKKRGELEIATSREMLLENKKSKLQDLVRNANTVLENAFKDAHDPEKVAAIYKKQLSNVVDVAYSAIETAYNNDGYATDEEKQQAALATIKQMRYNQDDYFWINDTHPKMVMHPFKPDLDGKDLSDFKDPKKKKLFVEMVKVCKADGKGFVDYMWPKPGADKPVPKLSYVKLFKPWNWIIGSGVSLEVAEEKLKNDAMRMIGKLRYGPEIKDYFWINDTHPNMVMHPYKPALDGQDLSNFKDPEGKHLFKEMVKVCQDNGEGFVDYMWPKPGSEKPVPKLSYVQLFKEWDWIVGTGIYIDDIDQLMVAKKAEINANIAAQIYKQIALVAVVCTLLSIATLIFIKRKISQPLIQASTMLKDIAEGEGDLTKRLGVSTHDETGDMAKWFNLFIDKLRQIISDIARNTQTLISSAEGLSTLSGQMDNSSKVMSSKSDSVAIAADQLSSNMNSVAATMEQAASNINIVAAASEEMTATINEIARNTENAHNISGKAVSQTGRATENISELGQAAQGIGKITETISEISEQTNLLALNATIEAARAGEAGKGFAVVANEIKELAKQTADATYEIKKQIEGIQSSSSGTVTEIQQISKVINDVNEMISTISAAVEEQSVTTKEIANNLSQASAGIQNANDSVAESSSFAGDIANNISEVNQEATEMANSSAQLKKSAEDLNHLAEELNTLVNIFKI